MRTNNIPFLYRMGLAFLVLYLGMLLLAPYASTAQVKPFALVSPPSISSGTTIDIYGFSSYDAYDRIVSVMDGSTEIARVITPLHRNGTLPNTFNDVVTLPYSLKDALTWQMPDEAQLWNVSTKVLATSNQNTEIISLIPFTQANSGALFDMNLTQPGEVYFLISGHDQLESVNTTVSIDNVAYSVYNWHPLNDDAQLTTVGAVIPYITVNMTKGLNTLVLSGSSQFFQSNESALAIAEGGSDADAIVGGVPYFFVSAFEVVTTTNSATTY